VGSPRIAVFFRGFMTEGAPGTTPVGQFAVTLIDSIGRRVFVDEARLNGILMQQEFDDLGLPARYLLTPGDVPGLAIGDTVRFEVIDGGDLTTPFTYVIVPSHLVMPPDSSVLRRSEDLELPWTGAIERVIVTINDRQGVRISVTQRFENYTGDDALFIPARDMAGLALGELQVGTDVLDTELVLLNGQLRQEVSFETRQSRIWRLDP
jgi:hypothetical protein